MKRFWDKVDKSGECWLWTASNCRGYGTFKIWGTEGKILEHWRAHRYSWHIHFGPIPEGMYVLHHCDTPGCVNPDHLFLGTQADNLRDMFSKGRAKPRGVPFIKTGEPNV